MTSPRRWLCSRKRRSSTVRFYRQASHLLTPFFQSRLAPLGWLRDAFMGLACHTARPAAPDGIDARRHAPRLAVVIAARRRGPLPAQRASLAKRPGVRPKRAAKWRVRWLWSAKPVAAAASDSAMPSAIIFCARASRRPIW